MSAMPVDRIQLALRDFSEIKKKKNLRTSRADLDVARYIENTTRKHWTVLRTL